MKKLTKLSRRRGKLKKDKTTRVNVILFCDFYDHFSVTVVLRVKPVDLWIYVWSLSLMSCSGTRVVRCEWIPRRNDGPQWWYIAFRGTVFCVINIIFLFLFVTWRHRRCCRSPLTLGVWIYMLSFKVKLVLTDDVEHWLNPGVNVSTEQALVVSGPF